jgi:hypothetical protein
MTSFRGVLDLQAETVVDALKAQRDARCREIESAAAHKAEQLLAESRHRLRERIHESVVEERQRRETALLDSRHRIETADRRRVQQHYRTFLQEATPQLREELQRRWGDAGTRRSWCDMLIGEAADRLAAEPWTVEHPGDWSDEDVRWLERAFVERGLPAPELREDAAITAGLRLRLEGACFDATLDGLMANLHAVEARLLAAWEREVAND